MKNGKRKRRKKDKNTSRNDKFFVNKKNVRFSFSFFRWILLFFMEMKIKLNDVKENKFLSSIVVFLIFIFLSFIFFYFHLRINFISKDTQ